MTDLKMITEEISNVEGEKALYELSSVKVKSGERFIVSISYCGEDSICALDVSEYSVAAELFDLIVRSQTTPVSLFDTVYDILH